VCTCASNYYWNGTDCGKNLYLFSKALLFLKKILVPKLLGWQTCNNITTGNIALPCDNTLDLYCYSNYTCQCPSTMYWDTNEQRCGMT
jgi:hypothetical protein